VSHQSAEDFYDGLAAEYHLIFADWWTSAQWHGQFISTLLSSVGVRPGAQVLDCTCGIGTQALPLAKLGYAMTGTDLSRSSIDRAKSEAESREIPITLSVADVRRLPGQFTEGFDAVISCDNALPHLLNDSDLIDALTAIHRSLRASGLFLATIRDYDALRSERSAGIPPSILGAHGSRHGYAQAWHWSDDMSLVDISLFLLSETSSGWSVSVHETTYRALLRADLDAALLHSGFTESRWLMPDATGFYQPIVIARGNPQWAPR